MILGGAPLRGRRSVFFKKYRTPQQRLKGYYRRTGYYGRFYANRQNSWMPELKFIEFSVLTIPVPNQLNTALNYTNLNTIANSTGESGRIGRKITFRYLEIRGDFTLLENTTANATTDVVRMVIFVDKQTNGFSANLDAMLSTVTNGEAVNAPYLLENQGRFSVICDKMVHINALAGGIGATASSGRSIKSFRFQTMMNVPMEYAASTGAITEIASNSLHLCFVSKRNLTSVKFTARARFSDN